MKVSHKYNSNMRCKQKDAGYSKLVLVLFFVCVIVLAGTKICRADVGSDAAAEKFTALGFRQLQGVPRSECCENPPKLNSSYGAGHVEELGGLKCYVTGCDDSKFAVILISDVYGYEAPHLRMIADKVAAAAVGFYVLVPDFFHGDPYVANNPQRNLTDWKNDHNPLQGFEDAKPLIEALKNKGIVKVGAAGFCWGGKAAVELSKSNNYINAAVLLHPSEVSLDDIKGVKVPMSVLGAELDSKLPPTLMRQFAAALDANGEIDDSFVKIYPGVRHGWTLRYNDTDATAVKNADEAHQDMLNWFLKHLNF